MTKTSTSIQSDMYLAAIRYELADVPWNRREDLLATVSERLAELPNDAIAWDELGPASAYARELRESAGLPPQSRSLFTRFRATRRRTKVTTALVVMIVALVVALLVAVPTYQPVNANVITGAGTARGVDDNLVTDTDFYVYQPGRIIVRGIQIRDEGRFAATVEGVSLIGSPYGPLALRELRSTGTAFFDPNWQRAPKVKNVTVGAGKTIYLFVVMRIVTFAEAKGDSTTIDEPKVRLRILGVHHLITVAGNKIGVVAR